MKNIKFKEASESHMRGEVPKFKHMARVGGNQAYSSVSGKWTIKVPLDANNLAQWEPNPRNTNLLKETSALIKSLGDNIVTEGLVHPFLGIARVEFHEAVRDEIAELLFNNCANPRKRFGQFLCSIGMRSLTKDKRVTWTFDPNAYNRVGYRITVGGDKTGGKPLVVFV